MSAVTIQFKNELLRIFPNIELSYEIITHNKVYYSNFYLAIPHGKKYFAWFLNYKHKNFFVLLEIKEKTEISNIEVIELALEDDYKYNGNIFYGTAFHVNDNKYFAIEDIFYYEGKFVHKKEFSYKINITRRFLQKKYSFCIFGLPIITTNFNELLKIKNHLPYKIKYVECKKNYGNRIKNILYLDNLKKSDHKIDHKIDYKIDHKIDHQINLTENHQIQPNTPLDQPFFKIELKTQFFTFLIKPDIQNDIYNLHIHDNHNNIPIFYDLAYIPNYKTSVMMNKLFRNIKENHNLDLLEESDDEEEFQNDKIDKFVFLDKQFNMTCVYNNKFKKFIPIKIAKNNDKLVTQNDLDLFFTNKKLSAKNYYQK
jgi:hypothetical protein